MTAPAVRYRVIDRTRRSDVSLDEQLAADHPVRAVWDFVRRLDLSAFDRPAKAVEGHAGAPVVPATLLFALWLFAVIDGTVSARRLARLCRRDLPFQWLCGGQPVNYHTLADFYADHAPALHDLWVEHVAALRQQQLVRLHTVTLDGRKIPAAASKDTARREGTLRRHLAEAREHLRRLEALRDREAALAPRRAAARRRGARDRVGRLEQAVAVVQRRQAQRRASKRTDTPPEDARASETDPEAAKMKLPDGGYRLAYNVQTVTDEASGLIVTVAVTDQGSDTGQAGPLLRQLAQEQQARPQAVLLDSGFADAGDITALEQDGVEVLMPPRQERVDRQAGRDPYARKRRDNQAVAGWRARMGTAAAQARYRRRAPVAEGVHAQQANRGWRRFRLRGRVKAQAEACWQALGYNLLCLLRRGVALAGTVRAA
jgi:transposase